MAQKTYFINSDNALYDDEEFAWFQTLLLTAGIVGDPDTGDLNGYLVHENTTPSLAVLVDTGKALLEIQKDSRTFKIVVENLSQETLTIENNDGAAESRVDSIIINLDTSVEPDTSKTNVASIEVVKGDSATALTDSEIDTAVGDQFWYRLADVEVRADTTQILNSDITDQRTKIKFSEAWQREYDPINAQGDLIRGDTDGVSERLPIGADGNILSVSSGLPIWKNYGVNKKTFASSGTWTKPDGLLFVIVEMWGGGGSGANTTYDYGTGGGGGAYNKKLILAEDLASSETVSVASGGTGPAETGGTSSFGSHLYAYGGGGGANDGSGGGGGGQLAAGSSGGLASGDGLGGSPGSPVAGTSYYSDGSNYEPWDGLVVNGTWGGGAGGGRPQSEGGNSLYGGGGGAVGKYDNIAGGKSVYGGDGGGSNAEGVDGDDGNIPGGGGAGSEIASPGSGARGEVRIYEFF